MDLVQDPLRFGAYLPAYVFSHSATDMALDNIRIVTAYIQTRVNGTAISERGHGSCRADFGSS